MLHASITSLKYRTLHSKQLMHQSIMLDQAKNLSECADDKPEAMSCDLRMSRARDPALVAHRPGDGDVAVQG